MSLSKSFYDSVAKSYKNTQNTNTEVAEFVKNGGYDPQLRINRTRDFIVDVAQNRELYQKSFGNVLTRTNEELGISNEFGRSTYDRYATLLSEMRDPTDLRASHQPGILKITNGVFGAITTAAATTIQPFADLGSLFYVISPYDKDRSRFSNWLDNPIQQGLQNVQKTFSQLAPIYRYTEEQNSDLTLLERMGYTGWWAEDFIKNIGFTVGAAIGGKGVGLLTNKATNAIVRTTLKRDPQLSSLFKKTSAALTEAAAQGDDVSELVNTLRQLDIPQKEAMIDKLLNTKRRATFASTTVGMVSGAVTEAHIEALQAKQSFVDSNMQHIEQFYNTQNPYANLEYRNEQAKRTIPQDMTLKEFCDMKKTTAKQIIDKNADKVMSRVFMLETLLLSATNAIAWRDWYDVSFDVAAKQMRESSRFFTFNRAKNTAKERKNRLSASMQYVKNIGTEWFEEMAQSGITAGVEQWAGSVTNKAYRDAIIEANPDYQQHVLNTLGAAVKGLEHMFGTHDSWTEGFIGGVMGAIGLPGSTMTRAQRKAENISVFNKKAWEMKGGVFEAYRKNKMDRDFAREFVNKVQETFKDGTTANQILEHYVALEVWMDAQKSAAAVLEKMPFIHAKMQQKFHLFEIYRLTKNTQQLAKMYESIMAATAHSNGETITDQQRTFINLVKKVFDNENSEFDLTDEEILDHLYNNAKDARDALESHSKISQKINTLINVYENQLDPDEARQASSLMTQILFQNDMNRRRIKSIQELYIPEDIEFFEQIRDSLPNATSYYENEQVLGNDGKPQSRLALKQNLIKELSIKLASIKDENGENVVELDQVKEIAEDYIDLKELQLEVDEQNTIYAQMLSNIVSEIRKFKKQKADAINEKNNLDLQSTYERVLKLLLDISTKQPGEYDEIELLSELKGLFGVLQEYSKNELFKKLSDRAKAWVGTKPADPKLNFYFFQLTEKQDRKNEAVLKYKNRLPSDLVDKLLSTLPARVPNLLNGMLENPDITEDVKKVIRDFIEEFKNAHWYHKAADDLKLLTYVSSPTQSGSSAQTGNLHGPTIFEQNKNGNNTPEDDFSGDNANIPVTNLDDAIEEIKKLVGRYNDSLFPRTSDKRTIGVDYNNNTKELKFAINVKADVPEYGGTITWVFNFNTKTVKVNYKTLPISIKDITKNTLVNKEIEILDLQFSYDTNTQIIWSTLKNELESQIKNSSLAQVLSEKPGGITGRLPKTVQYIMNNMVNGGIEKLIENGLFTEETLNLFNTTKHFVLLFRSLVDLRAQNITDPMASSNSTVNPFFTKEQFLWQLQLNNLIADAMQSNFVSEEQKEEQQKETLKQTTTPESTVNNNLVRHSNGFLYHQSAIDTITQLNEKLKSNPANILEPYGIQNATQGQIKKFATSNGMRVVEDEDGKIIAFDVIDTSERYNNLEHLVVTPRFFSVGDTVIVADIVYKITKVSPDGRIIAAEGSNNTTFEIATENNGRRMHVNKKQNQSPRPQTDKSKYNGLRSSWSLSEFDFAIQDESGNWIETDKDTQLNTEHKDFPTFSTWLKKNLQVAYDNVGRGIAKVGDTVQFELVDMSDISDEEKKQIKSAYDKISANVGANLLISGSKIVKVVGVSADGTTYDLGFLNPVGAYAKTAILTELFTKGLQAGSNKFVHTTTIETINTTNEKVVYSKDNTKRSDILTENFSENIFVVKINGKLYCNQRQTDIPKTYWDAIERDQVMAEGQLYLIPRHSNGYHEYVQPIALIYGMSDMDPNDLIAYLDDVASSRLIDPNEWDRLQSLKIKYSDPADVTEEDKQWLSDFGFSLKVLLNDTLYFQNKDSEIFVSVDYDGVVHIEVRDSNDNLLARTDSSVAAFNVELNNEYNLRALLNEVIPKLLNVVGSGLRITSTNVVEANDNTREHQAGLYQMCTHNLIRTTAVKTRMCNANVILHSDLLNNEPSTPQVLPTGAQVQNGGATYTPTRQVPRSNITLHSGGADGSDSYWDDVAAKYNITDRQHHYHGKKSPRGNVEMTQKEYDDALPHVQQAAKNLGKQISRPDTLSKMARNWKAVNSADEVFAISTIDSNGKVPGGTGWGIQMAIDSGKPVYVFDQNQGLWYKYNYSTFKWDVLSAGESPKPTSQKLCTIGTREINQNGKNAIENFFSVNFGTGQPVVVTTPVAQINNTTSSTPNTNNVKTQNSNSKKYKGNIIGRDILSDDAKKHPFAVFAVVEFPDGTIAATTRRKSKGEGDKIGLPGGKVDEGEDPITALRREAAEEGWQLGEVGEIVSAQLVNGNPILWYAVKSATILTDYAEMYENHGKPNAQGVRTKLSEDAIEIKPIVVSKKQIGSDYGNDFISGADPILPNNKVNQQFGESELQNDNKSTITQPITIETTPQPKQEQQEGDIQDKTQLINRVRNTLIEMFKELVANDTLSDDEVKEYLQNPNLASTEFPIINFNKYNRVVDLFKNPTRFDNQEDIVKYCNGEKM